MSGKFKLHLSVKKILCGLFVLVLIHGILVLIVYAFSGGGWLPTFLPNGISVFSNYLRVLVGNDESTRRQLSSDHASSNVFGQPPSWKWANSRHDRNGPGNHVDNDWRENQNDNMIDTVKTRMDGADEVAELKRRNRLKLKAASELHFQQKLKKKLFQKMLANSTSNDVIQPMPFVDLPQVAVWNVSTLNDYFIDIPDCRLTPSWMDEPKADKNNADPKENLAVKPFLLIIVTSSPDNFEAREAIRQSWGRPASSDRILRTNVTKGGVADDHHYATPPWKTMFLVGQSVSENADTLNVLIENEMERHGDILLGDYQDTYRNLTLKVLHGMYYASTRCRPNFLMKADDDVFVNVPLLVDFLSRYNTQTHLLYVGHVSYRSKVIRQTDNRWHVSSSVYAPDHYPPYALGGGYIISGDLLEPLLSTSARLLPFPNEDAYVGILMNVLRVSPVHSSRFTLYHIGYSECNLLYLMGIHNVKPNRQAELLAKALRARDTCRGQKRIKTWR